MTNFKTTAFTLKVIRINHNREVNKFFRKNPPNSKSQGATKGREALKNALLIYPNDSGIDVLNKQVHFNMLNKNEESILSVPESWMIHHGKDISQLKIIYRAAKSRSGNYDICIPHYNGSKGIKPPTYTKGNTPVVFNLKDRSKIVVNTESETEGKNLIKYFLKFVDKKFLPSNDAFVLPAPNKVKRHIMKPIRADYYPKGQESLAAWRIYF